MKFIFLLLGVIPAALCDLENDKEKDSIGKKNNNIQPNELMFYDSIYTECGGVIPLNPVLRSYIKYKVGQLYDPFEFCIWTLVSQDEVTTVRMDVSKNFQYQMDDGIYIYFWESTGLTYKRLSSTSENFNFNATLAFLVFTSDDSAQSNGFSIQIDSSGVSGTKSVVAYHAKKDEGEFSYPMVADPMRNPYKAMSLILQRKTPGFVNTQLGVKLTNVDVDEGDSIQVYSLNPFNWSQKLAVIGWFNNDAEFEVQAFSPVLIIFQTKNKLKGKSFQVEWKPFPHFVP